eukprot:2860490-Pyramimonas_sp.AAC.1
MTNVGIWFCKAALASGSWAKMFPLKFPSAVAVSRWRTGPVGKHGSQARATPISRTSSIR